MQVFLKIGIFLLGLGFTEGQPLIAKPKAKKHLRQKRSSSKSSKRRSAVASKKSKKYLRRMAKKKTIRKSPKISKIDQKYLNLKKLYRHGEYNSQQLWAGLEALDRKGSGLSKAYRQSLNQIQASMLSNGGFPLLAGLYAVDAIKSTRNPNSPTRNKSWSILADVSQRRPMHRLLEETAGKLKISKAPLGFGNNWFYYKGNYELAHGRGQKALYQYKKLRINDRHFISAKYQSGTIYALKGDVDSAEVSLKTMLNSTSQTLAPLEERELTKLSNYAKIALARLYYQDQKFKTAIKFYRAVDRDSELFYDALFEQSWAFFMAGYPNHSLGAIHGVESPFFKDVFNPESSVLKAIAYYWMCRYEDSRAALADFTEKHSKSVESLSEFLDRKRLSEETAYQLFENFVSGVSSRSLGMSKAVLESAASQESMLLLRDQYAALVKEMDRIDAKGIYNHRQNRTAVSRLRGHAKLLRKDLGAQFLAELRGLKVQYEKLYEQSQFLYVELLMSEKEQMLGRELHASSKIDHVTRRKQIVGWGKNNQSWADNRLNEYWWDEVGFYIYNVKPMCKSK